MGTAAPPAPSWLAHPMAPALLGFSQLPSHWLHRSRATPPEALAGAASLHRHRSAQLARELALEPVTAFGDAALPFALLPPDRLDVLLRYAGIALLAAGVRHTIARESLTRLRAQLGEDGLRFARSESFRLHAPAIEERVHAESARDQCERWGAALMALALEGADPAVARRGLLRLPASLDEETGRLRRTGMAPAQALALLRAIAQTLETEWLSSFPATH